MNSAVLTAKLLALVEGKKTQKAGLAGGPIMNHSWRPY